MLTVEDLKAELKDYTWDILTEDDTAVGENALEIARTWVKARLASVSLVYNPDREGSDEVVRRIVLSYALYRLYAYAKEEGMAQSNKADAVELMAAYLSASAAKDPVTGPGAPVGAISAPKRRRR